jgi:hypothetical protein
MDAPIDDIPILIIQIVRIRFSCLLKKERQSYINTNSIHKHILLDFLRLAFPVQYIEKVIIPTNEKKVLVKLSADMVQRFMNGI